MANPSVVGTPSVTNFPAAFADVTSYAITRTGVTAGNPLYVWHGGVDTLSSISSIAGAGATWTKLQGANGSSVPVRGELWQGLGTTGGSVTVTVTMSTADCVGGIMYEVANGTTESSSFNAAVTSSSTPLSPTGTPSASGDLVIVGLQIGVSVTSGPSSPWTYVAGAAESTTAWQPTAYQPGTASGTGYSTTFTCGSASGGVGFALVIKTAGPQVIGTPTVVNSATTTNPAASRTGVGAGNLLVAWFSNDSNLMNITACTGGGATWSRLQTGTNGNAAGDLWVGTGGTGGSITVTGTGTSDLYGVTLYELSNAAAETSSMTTFSGTNVSPSGTPATTGDAVMAFIISDVFCSSLPSAPWISIIGNSRQNNSSTYQVGVTGGALQTASTFTLHAAAAGWQAVLILKTPGGGGGSTPPQPQIVMPNFAQQRASSW